MVFSSTLSGVEHGADGFGKFTSLSINCTAGTSNTPVDGWERHSAQGGRGGVARTTPRTPQTPQTPRTPRVPVHDVQQLYRRSDIIEHNISIGIELAAVLEAAGANMNEWLRV